MAAETTAAQALGRVDLFAGLSPRQLEKIASLARTVHHQAGKEITAEGDQGVSFQLILSGSAEVSLGGAAVSTIGPGDYFGEISLIDGKPRSATVRAITDTETLALVSWAFTPLLDEEPGLTKALLIGMCARLRAAEARA